LSKAVDNETLIESFKKNNEETHPLSKEVPQKYIQAIDEKYRVQNQIPGKKYIILSRDGEYKKRIF